MRKILFISVAMAVMVLAGCSGVRNLRQPDLALPLGFTEGIDKDSACVADMEWWEFYTDSTLRKIIGRTLENNRDLLKAAARIEEMRELYGVDKANMFPEIGLNVYANDETNDYGGSGLKHDREIGVKLPVSYEVNLLGALSWARKEGKTDYLATVEDYRAMQVTLIAETAEAYFRLIALDNELSIVRRTVETREESLRMAKIRFEGGLTSETVYRQAMVEYSSAAALIPSLEQQLTVARNALTVLMGEYPHEILERGKLTMNAVLTEKCPAGVPSQLLERRPDVKGAELRLASAMANAGYTYANRFPNLRLGFTPGLENNELKDFFKSPFTYVIGSITGPLFDFGKRKRRYKASVAAYEQARLAYEQTVIQAFTEVNTAISRYKQVQETCRLRSDLRDATAKYIQLANLQYRAGTLNYIDVLDAQRRYFDAEIGVSNAVRDEYLALINLYKVLGGGWELGK